VDGGLELRVTLDVPFELKSMAEAELDISATGLRLRGTAGNQGEAHVPLPEGFVLDPDRSTAKFSKKRCQLTVTGPSVAPAPAPAPDAEVESRTPASPPASSSAGGAFRPPARGPAEEEEDDLPPPLERRAPAAAAPAAAPAAEEEEEEDDDDLPPALDSAHSAASPRPSRPPPVAEVAPAPKAKGAEAGSDILPACAGESNAAAEALMQKALAARQKVKEDTEKSRKAAAAAAFDGASGIKKGFLSGGLSKSKKKEEAKPAAKSPLILDLGTQQEQEPPSAAAAAAAKLAAAAGGYSLQASLPGGQQSVAHALEAAAKADPKVAEAMRSLPFSDPKVAEAFLDPEVQAFIAAMQKGHVPDMQMVHREKPQLFEKVKLILDASAPGGAAGLAARAQAGEHLKPSAASASKAPASSMAPTVIGEPRRDHGMPLPTKKQLAQTNAAAVSGVGPSLPISDPKVMEAFQDPEVQALINALRQGHPLEMHELARQRPQLFYKVKILLDNGLLAMQT